MRNEHDYQRLSPEYNAVYSRNKTRAVTKHSYAARFVISAVIIAFFIIGLALFAGDNDSRKYVAFTILPILAVAIMVSGFREKGEWDKSERLIAKSAAYGCAVTDCGLHVRIGRHHRRTYILLFKFVYVKNGVQFADMCETEVGVFVGDLPRTRIVLYETQDGEKVISVTLLCKNGEPDKNEYRILCR